MTRLATVAALVLAVTTQPALAGTLSFGMSLGARQLGTVSYDGGRRAGRLLAVMDNTPLGVADGSFEAVTRADAGTVSYESRSRGSKQRDIAVTRAAGRVTAVTVTPADEATALSDPARVPRGAISLTEAFAAIALGVDCPKPMAVHDGRRVVRIATAQRAETAEGIACIMSYRVVAGPGHLSPFRFKSLGMRLDYGGGGLQRITLSAGGFDVTLTRQD
ncbi:hypothetical protein BOO69_13900 [Sulfitobacter alexandrii]|uniref:DUF3108 domain-containing protein n=1 Tax=Sulfitobacter alexandrii TaxID=1917485 RepID=A0A1J0WJ83_9RHOB|nr:hypothetical protein [Sulfitobacter alexandrii]APE44377.1 hypothetical protein BOO69_13900 [Sulfitobacter alexandrii]